MKKFYWILGQLRTKPRTLCCLIYVAFLLVTLSLGSLASSGTNHLSCFFVDQDTIQQQFETTWRKTRFGWEDSSKWTRPPAISFERRIELIHPFAFAGMILTSSLCMMIWASNEWQTERLLRNHRLKQSENDGRN